ncbi:uncharacterized protein PV07_08451 [Cladophialophora immunda]|uniref:Uncharacterized protein n=1 Tax=Cladophialophora immunda TaxID=569365 RepID=A0A0D2C424_9EURO|nr:uncharacterized protein PV07_08451 [Cladophialophora immunda]KIW25260.1 hypothetical protein PV07_08451 [Cladophialophora immunda]
MAHEFDYFGDVLRATWLIVFMGTLHRESQIAAALGPLATFANLLLDLSLTSGFAGSMRTDLIGILSRDSAKLDEINQSFKRRANVNARLHDSLLLCAGGCMTHCFGAGNLQYGRSRFPYGRSFALVRRKTSFVCD